MEKFEIPLQSVATRATRPASGGQRPVLRPHRHLCHLLLRPWRWHRHSLYRLHRGLAPAGVEVHPACCDGIKGQELEYQFNSKASKQVWLNFLNFVGNYIFPWMADQGQYSFMGKVIMMKSKGSRKKQTFYGQAAHRIKTSVP